MAQTNQVRSFMMLDVLEQPLINFITNGDDDLIKPFYDEADFPDTNVIDISLINFIKFISTAFGSFYIEESIARLECQAAMKDERECDHRRRYWRASRPAIASPGAALQSSKGFHWGAPAHQCGAAATGVPRWSAKNARLCAAAQTARHGDRLSPVFAKCCAWPPPIPRR